MTAPAIWGVGDVDAANPQQHTFQGIGDVDAQYALARDDVRHFTTLPVSCSGSASKSTPLISLLARPVRIRYSANTLFSLVSTMESGDEIVDGYQILGLIEGDGHLAAFDRRAVVPGTDAAFVSVRQAKGITQQHGAGRSMVDGSTPTRWHKVCSIILKSRLFNR